MDIEFNTQNLDKKHAMRALHEARNQSVKLSFKPLEDGVYRVSIDARHAHKIWKAIEDIGPHTRVKREPTNSPAITHRTSEYRFGKHVPILVQMLKTTTPVAELAASKNAAGEPMPILHERRFYPVFVTSNGTVLAQTPNGGELGLEHDEYEVADWMPVAA